MPDTSPFHRTPSTLLKDWTAFDLMALRPILLGQREREIIRTAFYAGATAMFALMMDATHPEDERECEGRLAALEEEINAFARDLLPATKES